MDGGAVTSGLPSCRPFDSRRLTVRARAKRRAQNTRGELRWLGRGHRPGGRELSALVPLNSMSGPSFGLG